LFQGPADFTTRWTFVFVEQGGQLNLRERLTGRQQCGFEDLLKLLAFNH
jgi:hypothetical protein